MNFALLIIFMFVAFGLTTLFRRWIDVPTLIAVAIGCACNANIFTPISYGIEVGPFIFSIENVLYTLFMYTIVVRILDYGYKQAKVMTFTSIAAIIISAFIELVALSSWSGFSLELLKKFSFYLFSCLGTILGVWIMIWITIKCREKNISSYIIIPLAIAASCMIHSLVYYGSIALIEWRADVYPVFLALGAIIGKAACILLSVLCYFINQKYWKPLNLVKKEESKVE